MVSKQIILVETLAGASNSPRTTNLMVNLTLPPETSSIVPARLLGGFETTTEWSNPNSLPITLDTVKKVQGAASVKFTPPVGSGNVTTLRGIPNYDMTQLGVVAFYALLEDDFDWQTISSVSGSTLIDGIGTVYSLCSRTGLEAGIDGQVGGIWVAGSRLGANAAVQAAGVGNHAFRATATSSSSRGGTVGFDAFYSEIGSANDKADIVLTFDDVKNDAYNTALPVMEPLGLVGELYVPTDLLGTPTTLTWAQVLELAAKGWHIGVNGTRDDNTMASKGSMAALEADLAAAEAEFTNRGLPKPTSGCYPFGSKRANGTRTEKASVDVSGNTLTVSDTADITVGMRVVCQGVSKSCRVTAIGSGTITLNESVTTAFTARPAAFVDDSGAFHGTKIQEMLKTRGYKWFRSTINGYMFVQFGIAPDHALQYPSFSTTGLTLSQFQTYVNSAIRSKSVVSLYIHRIRPSSDTAGNNWVDTEFTACMQWLKTQIDAGLIRCSTTKDLTTRYGGRSTPS